MYGGYDSASGYQTLSLLSKAMTLNLTSFVIEIVTYAPNIGVFVWTSLSFSLDNAGGFSNNVKNQAFRLHHYAGSGMSRIACEVLFVLFVFYYTYQELLFFVGLWEDQREKDEEGDVIKAEPDAPRWARILVCFYIDPKKAAQESIVSVLEKCSSG